jgi:hypothetical protein
MAARNALTFSPVHKHRKFSAVLGTTSERSSITMRPAGVPPMVMSRKTFGSNPCCAAIAGANVGTIKPMALSGFKVGRVLSEDLMLKRVNVLGTYAPAVFALGFSERRSEGSGRMD